MAMKKELNETEKQCFQFDNFPQNSEGYAFVNQSDLCDSCQFERNDTPNYLCQSLERFLIGNVL